MQPGKLCLLLTILTWIRNTGKDSRGGCFRCRRGDLGATHVRRRDMGDSALTAADVAPVVSENARPAAKSANFGKQSAWNYAVFAVSKSSTLLMTVVVARLLDPAEFGIFALALLLVNLFDYVKDLGVAAALVQSPRPWNRIAPTGLTLSVAFGVAFGVLLAIAADSTADLLHHPELGPLIRVLAIALTISAFSVVPLSRLRRDLSFQSRLLPEFSGAIVKTALTIGLAATHHGGVWSLVYGQLAGVVVTTVLYWRAAPASVRPPHFDRAEARALLRFGIPVTGVTLLAYGIYNVDYLAVGTRLGTTELGLYTLAYRVPELVVLNLCTVISEVLFSSLSRLQHDRKALSAHYRQTLGVVVALTAPIGIGLAAIAKPLLETMYAPDTRPPATYSSSCRCTRWCTRRRSMPGGTSSRRSADRVCSRRSTGGRNSSSSSAPSGGPPDTARRSSPSRCSWSRCFTSASA